MRHPSYDSLDLRRALKWGIDRQKIIDTVYKGYATIGNDTTVGPLNPYFDKDLPQTPYDPEKAAFHYKKAGSPKLELKVSEGAFSGATDAGVLYQEAMKQAGIDLTVTRVSGDGYWSNVWLKVPFCAVLWCEPSGHRHAAFADLPVERGVERHPLAAPGIRQARRRGPHGGGRGQAQARCTITRSR